MSTAHRESHGSLLAEFDDRAGRPLDAVVVPAGRSASHLRTAAALAAKAGSELLVLCDRDVRAAEVADVAREHGAPSWHAADLPGAPTSGLLAFPEAPAGLPERGGRVPLSRKRNAALLVARMVGWRTVLLLDDDIRDLGAAEACFATSGLGTAAAVGFAVADWPDNSVVCHANRISGRPQEVFVGGSALLIDTTSPLLGHFPTIYNEDWLFLFDALLRRKVARVPDPVRQLRYDPFKDLERGRAEEFGEVVAEGLVHYAHEPTRHLVPTGEGYWREFLACRREFLGGIVERLQEPPPSPRRRTAFNAVRTAERQHDLITPASCSRFVRHWRRERRMWLQRLPGLPTGKSVSGALRHLGMDPVSPAPSPARLTRWTVLSAPPARPRPASSRPVVVTKHPAPGSDTLAVVVPGFLDSGSGIGASTLATALQRAGHTALTFDPRGTWGSFDSADKLAPTFQVQDTISVIGSEPAHARVALLGHSLGGYIAGLAAAQDERVTDVVAIMPPRCFLWPRDYDAGRDTWRKERRFSVTGPVANLSWQFRVPHSVVDDAVQRHDLPRALAGLRGKRVLFVAGTLDRIIPAAAVRRLFDECGCVDRRLVELPVGHDYRDRPDHRKLVNDVVVEWLGRPVDRAPRAAQARPVPCA